MPSGELVGTTLKLTTGREVTHGHSLYTNSDRGITMLFVGYADEHAGNCYRMYNPVTSKVNVTRDVIWSGCMYFTNENCEKTKVLPSHCSSNHK